MFMLLKQREWAPSQKTIATMYKLGNSLVAAEKVDPRLDINQQKCSLKTAAMERCAPFNSQ